MASHKNIIIAVFAVIFGVIIVLIFISNQLVSNQIQAVTQVKATSDLPPAVSVQEPPKKKADHVFTETWSVQGPATPQQASPSAQEVKKIHEIPLDDVILLQ